MKKLSEQKAKNAIQCIDALPGYKQAEFGKRNRLGGEKGGFCCLGACCYELGINYDEEGMLSKELLSAISLKTTTGTFTDVNGGSNVFYKARGLAELNDATKAGFKRIATLMKTHPDWMFTEDVAELIKAHYEKA